MHLSRILKEKVFLLLKNRAKSILSIPARAVNIRLSIIWLLNWVFIRTKTSRDNCSFQSKKFKLKKINKVSKSRRLQSALSPLKRKKSMSRKWWKMKALIFRSLRHKIAPKNPELAPIAIAVVKIQSSNYLYYWDLWCQNRSL